MEGFPDVELALCEVLETIAPTVTELGDQATPPVIQVNRRGGGADRLGLQDSAIVEIQCWGEKRPDSQALNNAVRARLSGARGEETTAGFLDRIDESVAPMPIFDLNPDVRRATSTWQVVSRLQDLPVSP